MAQAITALEAGPLTASAQRSVIDADTLRRYMPKEESCLLPVAAPEGTGSSLSDSDKQMIVKAILDLKKEIDSIKSRLNSVPVPGKALKPVSFDNDEAEWQGQGAPVHAADISSNVDLRNEFGPEFGPKESKEKELKEEEKELSIAKSNISIVLKALEKHGGNRKLAAEEVGISERTLYRWLEKYKIETATDKQDQ